MKYILTLDAGTTGVKCAAFTRDGSSLFSTVVTYPTRYPALGWAQQKPEEQATASVQAIRSALEHLPAGDCEALVFTGTMNGCIPVDADGNALYDNLIHSDLRAEPETETIRRAIPLDEYFAVTGNRIDVHSGLPKYMWLKAHEPEVYNRAAAFVNIKDYLYGRATGLTGCTDLTDASLCSCLDLRTGGWAWDILTECGIDHQKMPQLRPSFDTSGKVSADFAALTGLKQGLPVAVGAGDGACAAHGARSQTVGDTYMNIGSSAWVSTMSEKPVSDTRLFNYFDNDGRHYNVCGTVQSGAAAFDWAAQNLFGSSGADVDPETVEAWASQVSPGAEGVFFLPTLMGERTPWWTAQASGTLIGFTLSHDRRHIARAVYEGIMQSLHMCGAILAENGLPASRLTLVGGGAKSALWAKMAADMFGVPVRVHQTPREATSLGAALTAGVGIGWYRDFADASQCIRIQKELTPQQSVHEIYQKHFKLYRSLYPTIRDAYEAIYRFQTE
ncbi:MAG: hypothetical protein IJJ80_00445 [Clostridia bacterium]|nr:hypothetical protein [Clostridia bacterium]